MKILELSSSICKLSLSNWVALHLTVHLFICIIGQFTAPKIGGAVVLSEHYFLLFEAVGNIQVSVHYDY